VIYGFTLLKSTEVLFSKNSRSKYPVDMGVGWVRTTSISDNID